MNKIVIIFIFIFGVFSAQEKRLDSIVVEHQTDEIETLEKSILEDNEVEDFDFQNPDETTSSKSLSPRKAGLYSAILPGWGQYYNKKYWKIPIVWGAIGTGVGVTLWYNKQYRRYRNAFQSELDGKPHEFSDKDWVTAEVLGRTQDNLKRKRDYAIAITGLVYVLNIVDAVVDAHLHKGKNDPDLAIKPTVIYNEYAQTGAMGGVSLNFKF